MVYERGGLVEKTDYDALISAINNLFGSGFGDSGYGGNSINVPLSQLTSVSVGATINNEEWLVIRNALFDLALHQNTVLPNPLPSPTDLEDMDLIQAFEALNDADNLNELLTNRLNANSANLSISNKLISNRSTSWTSEILHEFTVDFGNTDDARFFFNTGGEIRLNASRSGGAATPQNLAWTNLTSNNSPAIFNASNYYALTSSYTTVRSVSSTGAYSTNSWIIQARRDDVAGPNGGNGSIIRFKSIFSDIHSGVSDVVSGTFTSTIQERRSTVVFTRPSPIFTTITQLTAGS